MVTGIIALIIAYFLALVGFDEICIQAIKELFGQEFSSATYYFLAFLIGVLSELMRSFK